MPKQYLAIKQALLKQGKPLKTAERIAAATYNAVPAHKKHPVGRNSDKKG